MSAKGGRAGKARTPKPRATRRRRAAKTGRGERAGGPSQVRALPEGVTLLDAGDLDALRQELERDFPTRRPARWNASPEDAQRAVARLVLTLVEFLRKLMERQAIRRMEHHTLTPAQVEAVGQALMRLEETVARIGEQFDLTPEDLQLDLGPLGRLM